MYQWMQNNGKYLMAIVGVFLMIAYTFPYLGRGGSGSDMVRGRMGKVDIHQSELTRYRNEWDYLNHYAYALQQIPSEEGMQPEQNYAPITRTLGPTVSRQMQDHPEMFALLVEEANQMGVGVSNDQLQTILAKIKTPDEAGTQLIDASAITDSDRQNDLRVSLVDFLRVQNAFARAGSVIKTSQPLAQHTFATYRQQITLDMVEFSSEPYLAKVPAPTQQQMDEKFKKYADVDPATADFQTNPFDFGYRYPNRIKIQYVSVPRTTVFNAALKVRNQNDQTRYDWDVAAYRYYESHQSLYPATQPVAGSKSATTRPFKDVTDEARQAVLHDDADKLALSIRQRIISTMTADYMVWKNAVSPLGETTPTTHPVASPASSLGVAYDSDEYLTKLALMIQKNYGVLPTIVSTGDWQTTANIDSLAGISSATVDDPDVRAISFGSYAMFFYDQFLPEDQRQATLALSLNQPSEPLKTDENDFYIFRINAAELSHAPASISEVADQVKTDCRAEAAYKLAEADAQKFLAAAQSAKSISTAAKAAKLQVLETIPVRYGQSEPISGYSLIGPGLHQFSTKAFDLLSDATPANQHPIGLVHVEVAGRAIVAQLKSILPLWNSSAPLSIVLAGSDAEMQRELRTSLYAKWFDYDDLVARTGYHAVNNTNKQPAIPNNAPPNPPPL